MITIQELLYNRGLDKNSKIKLVRHQDKRYPELYDWYKNHKEKFLKYQAGQSKDVFNNTEYIISFIGEGNGTLSRFVGVYKIKNKSNFTTPIQIEEFDGIEFLYEIEEVNGFEDLKERVIIKWKNAIAWHQWMDNKMEVVEIQPGLHYKKFTDYLELILTFNELKGIIINQYSDWKTMLSSIKGVYLISDSLTGKLYVGSAYGEDGIWGRWSQYVSTNGHGNNKTLKELISENENYGSNFKFSILMILPKTITPDEAIKKENLFKEKLGSNSFGLNNKN